jgi:hypothetical protein
VVYIKTQILLIRKGVARFGYADSERASSSFFSGNGCVESRGSISMVDEQQLAS